MMIVICAKSVEPSVSFQRPHDARSASFLGFGQACMAPIMQTFRRCWAGEPASQYFVAVYTVIHGAFRIQFT